MLVMHACAFDRLQMDRLLRQDENVQERQVSSCLNLAPFQLLAAFDGLCHKT